MSETAQHNGTPATTEPPCEDCATTGEKILAGLAILFGVLIIAMGVDMATGGKLSGVIPVRGEPADG